MVLFVSLLFLLGRVDPGWSSSIAHALFGSQCNFSVVPSSRPGKTKLSLITSNASVSGWALLREIYGSHQLTVLVSS